VNPKVPVELERIVNRALARDINARYQTARELGQDLIRFLFTFGHPVGTFDIAALVQGAMRERQRGPKQPQGSIIDKLIEEALLEFTSLKEDATGPQGADGSGGHGAPLNPDQFVDPTNWANEIALGERAPSPHNPMMPGSNIEAGNLSALEEEGTAAGRIPSDLAHRPSQAPQPGAPRPPSGGKPKSGGSGALIGVMLFFVAALAAGAAYFAGFMPKKK
jgi:serine/threonine-protein kinase